MSSCSSAASRSSRAGQRSRRCGPPGRPRRCSTRSAAFSTSRQRPRRSCCSPCRERRLDCWAAWSQALLHSRCTGSRLDCFQDMSAAPTSPAGYQLAQPIGYANALAMVVVVGILLSVGFTAHGGLRVRVAGAIEPRRAPADALLHRQPRRARRACRRFHRAGADRPAAPTSATVAVPPGGRLPPLRFSPGVAISRADDGGRLPADRTARGREHDGSSFRALSRLVVRRPARRRPSEPSGSSAATLALAGVALAAVIMAVGSRRRRRAVVAVAADAQGPFSRVTGGRHR